MVLDSADATRVRDADHHRQREASPGAVAQLGDVRGDLLEGGVREGVELHFHHGPEAAHRHADGQSDDAGLGQRGVEAPLLAEVACQSVGDPEDTAEGADVLAEDEYALVLTQCVAKSGVQRLRHRDLGHGRQSS